MGSASIYFNDPAMNVGTSFVVAAVVPQCQPVPVSSLLSLVPSSVQSAVGMCTGASSSVSPCQCQVYYRSFRIQYR